MAMQPDPTQLTSDTKLPLPTHRRHYSQSRSPSRSPVRRAHFAATELDPLLKNLSPESTLEALLASDAIDEARTENNDLAKSVAEASESERKLSIRAAVASKKLKEWTDEVAAWPWPSHKDRAWGAGFITPESELDGKYLGSLQLQDVQKHEERLDEIFDAMDTLDFEELKALCASSHHLSTLSSSTSSYSPLRGITAVITGTVMQSLPVHARLQILLDTWVIRLNVLHQIPDLLMKLNQVKSGLKSINNFIEDPVQSQRLSKNELARGKAIFADKVLDLRRRIDNLQDTVLNEEDKLPQAWIDAIEDIESKYAHWVSKAERVVLRNEIPRDASQVTDGAVKPFVSPRAADSTAIAPSSTNTHIRGQESEQAVRPNSTRLQSANTTIKREPLLEVNPKADHGHKRGVSEVSMANSTFSNYSENAEILDAHATPVLPSPRISLIDHQFLSGTSKTSWMVPNSKVLLSPTRPPMVERASAASIEVVPKEQIRKVLLRKSASHDMLSDLNISDRAQSASHSPSGSPLHELGSPMLVPSTLTPLAVSPSPSLMVDPLSLAGVKQGLKGPPLVPRRSSKRRSMPLLGQFARSGAAPQHEEPHHKQVLISPEPPVTPPRQLNKIETFDDKLKNILASMPTPFQLSDSCGSDSSELNSETSSRSSSPQRILKLSPAKNHNANANFEERVYNLRNNKSKDAKPVRLLIRAVGANGDRIMVRVGGGWADLAEYLREYSLHHGSKRLPDGKLEVANYPAGQTSRSSTNGLHSQANHVPTIPDQDFDFGLTEREEQKSTEEKELEANPWRPPPVPVVTDSYAGPIARSTSPSRERTFPAPKQVASYRPASRTSVTTTTPTVTTTITSSNHYTPLGGAGPVINKRRSAAPGSLRSPADEAWIEGVVSKARSVSGGQASHLHDSHPHTSPITPSRSTNTIISSSPFTTTTTTISSSTPRATASRPSSRRLSSWSTISTPLHSTPENQRYSTISSGLGSQLSQTSSASSDQSNSPKRKSRISLGDVGGIRRVFLRKKSAK